MPSLFVARNLHLHLCRINLVLKIELRETISTIEESPSIHFRWSMENGKWNLRPILSIAFNLFEISHISPQILLFFTLSLHSLHLCQRIYFRSKKDEVEVKQRLLISKSEETHSSLDIFISVFAYSLSSSLLHLFLLSFILSLVSRAEFRTEIVNRRLKSYTLSLILLHSRVHHLFSSSSTSWCSKRCWRMERRKEESE